MDLIETIVGTLRDSSACHEVIEAVRARRSWLSELGAVDLENDTRPDWQLQERIAWIERTCELDSLEAQPELDPSSFEEAETLWAARVSRRFCGEVTPQEVPQAVLVTGQPGAGKSVVCEIARRELAGQGLPLVAVLANPAGRFLHLDVPSVIYALYGNPTFGGPYNPATGTTLTPLNGLNVRPGGPAGW